MTNMFLNVSNKRAELARAYQGLSAQSKQIFKMVLLGAFLMSPQLAFAADGTDMLCFIAQYFKQIAGSAALVVISIWAIEHFFGVAKLHDVVIKVGIGAAMIITASTAIAKSGLSSNCLF
jgi:hypothetical protein